GPDRRLEALQLLVAGAFAAVYGDELIGIRPELAQRLVHDLGVVAARELELLVDEPDHVPLLDLEAVGARVAYRMCDLDRLLGFVVWPASTTTSAPRALTMWTNPRPAATTTSPTPLGRAGFAGTCDSVSTMRLCWVDMSPAFSLSRRPCSPASAMTRVGSSV